MIEMFDMIYCSLWSAFILYILFETSAVYEYSRFLPNFITKMKTYREYINASPYEVMSYGDYMRTRYDSFLMRMLTCPVCIGVWISAACALTVQKPLLIPAIYLCSQLIYRAYTALINKMEGIGNEK